MTLTRAAVVSLVFFAATGARAADDQANVAAQALFDEAKQLIKKGDWAAACPKLAESERLDPGVGTLLNLAECYDHVGKTARAWATFREAEAMALHQNQQPRAQYAQSRAVALEGKLVRITIEVPEQARVPGLRVTRDEDPVNEPLWGTAVPVDPGEHVVVASAPGYKTFSTHVLVSRDPVVVRLTPLEAEPAPPTPPPPPVEPSPPITTPVISLGPTLQGEANKPATTATPSGSGLRTAGFVVGGVGVASVGVMSLFGVLAIDRDNASRAAGCNSNTCPTPGALDLTRQAESFALVANVALIAAAVCLTVGITFIAVGSPSRVAQALTSPVRF